MKIGSLLYKTLLLVVATKCCFDIAQYRRDKYITSEHLFNHNGSAIVAKIGHDKASFHYDWSDLDVTFDRETGRWKKIRARIPSVVFGSTGIGETELLYWDYDGDGEPNKARIRKRLTFEPFPIGGCVLAEGNFGENLTREPKENTVQVFNGITLKEPKAYDKSFFLGRLSGLFERYKDCVQSLENSLSTQ